MHSASCCFRLPAILASVRTLDTLRLLEHNLRHRITGAYQNRVFRFVFELQRNVSMKTGVDKASVLHCQPCATDGRTPLHKRRKMQRQVDGLYCRGECKLTGTQLERLTFLQNDFLVLYLVAQRHTTEPLASRNQEGCANAHVHARWVNEQFRIRREITLRHHPLKAIPHKERTTKRTKKGYNKEVKKQFKEQNE